MLNLLGMLPGVGAIADAINTVWYLAEHDFVNAAISTASLLPYVGRAVAAQSLSKQLQQQQR